MVKNLFKYEFFYYRRTLPIIYAVILAFAILTRILSLFASDTIIFTVLYGFSVTFFIISMVTVLIITSIITIVRFYNNIYGNEGYVTLTFPVTTTQHLFVKVTSAAIAELLSSIVSIIGVAIVSPKLVGELWYILFVETGVAEYFSDILGVHLGFYFAEMAILGIISLFSSLLLIYACISIGQLANKNKILLAFVAFFVHNVIVQCISSIISVIAAFSIENFTPAIDKLIQFVSPNPTVFIHTGFIIAIIISAVPATAYWAISYHILKKKVNLS